MVALHVILEYKDYTSRNRSHSTCFFSKDAAISAYSSKGTEAALGENSSFPNIAGLGSVAAADRRLSFSNNSLSNAICTFCNSN
jgi:hypothetical protein